MRKILLFLFLSFSPCFAFLPKTLYPLFLEPIDVVIPCHEKDRASLPLCIKGIRKNGANIRRIIVVSKELFTQEAEWFDENLYPFNKQDLLFEISQGDRKKAEDCLSRLGWIYQQLLKLYAPLVIPELSSNVLVLDADTIFLKPVHFLTPQGEPLFSWGKEYHQPYFDHAKRLLPGFTRVFPRYSGICHHMLLQRPIVQDLFEHIAQVHATEPWIAIVRCIDPKKLSGASFSEYEIYFNFAFARTNQAKLRKLKWRNINSLDDLKKYKKKGCDFVSCHVYR